MGFLLRWEREGGVECYKYLSERKRGARCEVRGGGWGWVPPLRFVNVATLSLCG